MSNEQAAPETKGVTVKLLAAVDLGPEIEGMAGRQLRMRLVTMEPGGVFGPIHDHKAGQAPSIYCKGRSPTIEMESRRTMDPEWAGPRTGTPRTGSRTEERFRRWRSRSISSGKNSSSPTCNTVGTVHAAQPDALQSASPPFARRSATTSRQANTIATTSIRREGLMKRVLGWAAVVAALGLDGGDLGAPPRLVSLRRSRRRLRRASPIVIGCNLLLCCWLWYRARPVGRCDR